MRLTRHLRAAVRLSFFATFTLLGCALWFPCLVLGWFLPRTVAPTKTRLLRGWARLTLAILRVRVELLGEPPEPPFLLVSNHVSYLDPILLMAHTGSLFLVRGDVADWPIFGPLTRYAGMLFVDRERAADLPRALGAVERALADGFGVGFFPEGTSSPGEEVLPFRPSFFEVAVRADEAVHAAAIGYATRAGDPPAREVVCWWGAMTFFPHLWTLFGLRCIHARLCFAPAAFADDERKSLARRTQEAVERVFVPLPALEV